MNSTEVLVAFLGWCTVINFSFLIIAAIAIIALRRMMVRVHGSMFAMDEQALSKAYFGYLAHYKLLVLVFNLVPYIALKIIT